MRASASLSPLPLSVSVFHSLSLFPLSLSPYPSPLSLCVCAYVDVGWLSVNVCYISRLLPPSSVDNQEEGPPALACFIIAALCPLSRRWLFMEQTAQGVGSHTHTHMHTHTHLHSHVFTHSHACTMYIQYTHI